MNAVERALRLLGEDVLRIAKETMQRIPAELDAYYNEFLGDRVGGDMFRETGSIGRLGRNRTNKLREVTGRLANALQEGGEGNITRITANEEGIVIESGIDPEVVPYALIHEMGGTINHPGGTPYMIGRGGRAVFLRKGDKRATGVTREHAIPIRARPYLKPGMELFIQKGFPRYIKRIQDRLVKEFN